MYGCGYRSSTVTLNDRFFSRIRETLVREGIPYQWEALNDRLPADTAPSYCMRNFRVAAGKEKGTFGGFVFQDSDLYKWLEGVAFSLRWHPDKDLEATADEAIAEAVSAQQPDGYLDTYYIINGLDKRFTNLKDNHELYVAGHMIEAAVAYFEVTGKRVLLEEQSVPLPVLSGGDAGAQSENCGRARGPCHVSVQRHGGCGPGDRG